MSKIVPFLNCLIDFPLGWNSWNHFGCDGYNYTTLKETVDSIVSNGLYDAGYNYLVCFPQKNFSETKFYLLPQNIDDCWAEYYRTENGTLQPDKTKFPPGQTLEDLINYVHDNGMLFGIYSGTKTTTQRNQFFKKKKDAGERTCADHDPGSLGHEQIDAQTFSDWGVDYLKYDNCYNTQERALDRYPPMRDALLSVQRPIFFSLCEWGRERVATWGRAVGNSWRTTKDIRDSWTSMIYNLYDNNRWADFGGPSGWNDPDMLEVGNGGMTTTEYTTHFSMWALMKAPLIIGCDVTNMSDDTKNILMNKEVIAVNQDPRGVQGKLVRKETENTEIWTGPLINGNYAVVLFNRGSNQANITLEWDDINVSQEIEIGLRDLWLHQNIGTFQHNYSTLVESHGVVMLKAIPSYSLDYTSFQNRI